ncbi:MAG: hypothetical protein M0R03_22035 [Novosphingobium sp.]|jgi:hypothetical protein|nr:hypothetical protein [Novosphingobium sp.]
MKLLNQYKQLLLENDYIVYHGTNNKINKFNSTFLGSVSGKTPTNMKGFFFTDNTNVAKSFGKYIITAKVKINNPKIINARGRDYSNMKYIINDVIDSIEPEYDGLIIKNYVDSMDENPQKSTQYLPFNINQIKIISIEKI